MRKTAIIGISILSVFILCSLSYQPIIADTPIENIKETKLSVSKIDRLRDFHKKLLERKSKEDCGCEDTTEWDYPIFCGILLLTVQTLDRITDRLQEQNMENTLLYLFSVVINNIVNSVIWNMYSYTTTTIISAFNPGVI